MTDESLQTHFASPERLPEEYVAVVARELEKLERLKLLDRMPVMVFLANTCRQIVYCNPSFASTVKPVVREHILGMRPGEALGCVFSRAMKAGCGCSEYCRHCGAAQAILKSLQGVADCRECHILTRDNLGVHAVDIQILSQPFDYEGEVFSLNMALDISHERRLHALNRSFLHGMINAAGGLENMFAFLCSDDGDEMRAHMPLLHLSVQAMLQEVLYQHDIMAADQERLAVNLDSCDLRLLVERLVSQLRRLPNARGREIATHGDDCTVKSDPRLLRHVLVNLVVNALEASPAGAVVDVRWERDGGVVKIAVENPGSIPSEIALQLFKRYVSTKGEDRGLGLYMAKVFTENYLGGRLAYEPLPEVTRFTVALPRPPAAS